MHKKFKAISAKLEAACRAGRPSFWLPFKVLKLSHCPVKAQPQLAYLQELNGTMRSAVAL